MLFSMAPLFLASCPAQPPTDPRRPHPALKQHPLLVSASLRRTRGGSPAPSLLGLAIWLSSVQGAASGPGLLGSALRQAGIRLSVHLPVATWTQSQAEETKQAITHKSVTVSQIGCFVLDYYTFVIGTE